LLVATKLGVADFETWARNELEGYEQAEPPNYRLVRGAPKVWNPYHGYQDLHCESPKFAENISVVPLNVSVDALEEGRGQSGGTWIVSYRPEREHSLMKSMSGTPLKPSLHISESAIRAVLGRIRTIVLQWSLTLEKQGVLGEGMTFSEKERSKATAIHIDTFIQGVSGSQIQVHSPGANQQLCSAQLARRIEGSPA
jgi:hypothetical protein